MRLETRDCLRRANADETPLGWVTGAQCFDIEGLANFSREQLAQLQSINYEDWRREIISQDELFIKIYSHLPKELIFVCLLCPAVHADVALNTFGR